MSYLVGFLWLIMVAVAMVATLQAVLGVEGSSWAAPIVWWSVVVGSYLYDRKKRKELN